MVRVGTPSAVARPDWYDRNPSNQHLYYEGYGISPHVKTGRWNYTVPAGKKALVELVWARLIRKSAATTLGDAYAGIWFLVSGGTNRWLAGAWICDNTVGATKDFVLGQSIIMLPGDSIFGYTADGSTGGTFDYQIYAKITEFDA